MKLYRLKINPLSAWRTPWQADTLAGLLCWTLARKDGGESLSREVIAPALAGRPPFVLSDAFPADFLPVPEILRLRRRTDDERRQIKRARWLAPSAFRAAQGGAKLSAADFLTDSFFLTSGHSHNTLDRATDTTSAAAGSPYTLDEVSLDNEEIDRALCRMKGEPERVNDQRLYEPRYLSLYARIEDGFEARFMDMFRALSETGFGADVSTGKGQFEILSELEDAGWLDAVGVETKGVISLSTFQPGPQDPTDGCWQAFTKYGKVGADFGLENVFKRPLIMLGPGACFKSEERRAFLGRAIAMREILSASNCEALRRAGAEIVHLAFGLAVGFGLDF